MENAAQTGSIKLECRQKEGGVMLFIADLNFELRFYSELLHELSREYEVHGVSLPGSDNVLISGVLTKKLIGNCVCEYIERSGLGGRRFSVFAHGCGCCALDFVLSRYSSCIGGLIVLNPPVFDEISLELIQYNNSCCAEQIDVPAMEREFARTNFGQDFTLSPRNFAEKVVFYTARDAFSPAIRDEFTQFGLFARDKEIAFHVVFSTKCSNMKFSKAEALKLHPGAVFLSGPNFCLRTPENRAEIIKLCSFEHIEHIEGEVEISV